MDTPRITTVAALAFQNKKVLLVRHGEAAHHLTGIYGLPGGRLDAGESLLDGAAREFQEETGLIPDKSSIVQIPTIYEASIPRKNGEILHTSWNVFLVKDYSGELIAAKEEDEAIPVWVEVGRVTEFNLLPNTQNAIKEGLQILNT